MVEDHQTMKCLEVRKMTLDLEVMKIKTDCMIDAQCHRYKKASGKSEILQNKIDIAKANNAQLMASILETKHMYDNLEKHLGQLRRKFRSVKKKLGTLNNEQLLEKETKELEQRAAERRHKVIKINKELHTVLLTENGYQDVASISRKLKTSPVSAKCRKPINAVPIRKGLTSRNAEWT